jgi:predicted Zn-dependent peptidase
MNEKVGERELTKVKNKIESSHLFAEMNVLDKAMNLAFFELMGDADMINHEIEKYLAVTADDVQRLAKEVFRKTNCSSLHYLSSRKN